MSLPPSFHSREADLLGGPPGHLLATTEPSFTTVIPLATTDASFTSCTVSGRSALSDHESEKSAVARMGVKLPKAAAKNDGFQAIPSDIVALAALIDQPVIVLLAEK